MFAQDGVVSSSAIGGLVTASAARRPGTGSSWREMPGEYGKWESAYRRHELWAKQGLWERILRVLGEKDLPGPATKEPN